MLRVLTYHRVAPLPERAPLDPDLVSATPEAFERQVRHLARHYRVVSAEEVREAARGGRALPARAVLVTFDDAYRDFGEVAWPILRRHRLPAVLFVPTAYPGHPERSFWWDRLHRAFADPSRRVLPDTPFGPLPLHSEEARRSALARVTAFLKTVPHADALAWVGRVCAGTPDPRYEAVLRWEELRELAADGVTLGGHTRTHPVLTRLSPDEARAEIRRSREELACEAGRLPFVFSYPFGAHDDAVVEAVREAGFELAVTCVRGQNHPAQLDPLRLRRTNITRRTTPLVFGLRLLPAVSQLDGWRHRRMLRRRAAWTAPSPTLLRRR